MFRTSSARSVLAASHVILRAGFAPPFWRSETLVCRAPVAQSDRAFASGAKGRRFESCRAHHKKHSQGQRQPPRIRSGVLVVLGADGYLTAMARSVRLNVCFWGVIVAKCRFFIPLGLEKF
jgi:hypothetical protein